MSRYADTLLAERRTDRPADPAALARAGRRRPLAPCRSSSPPSCIFILAAATVHGRLPRDAPLGSWPSIAGCSSVGLARTRSSGDWSAQDYLVTNRRVIKVEGILNKHSADSSLEKINDAVLDQSIFGRMLGYGDLDILTATEESVDRYRMLDKAAVLQEGDARPEARPRVEATARVADGPAGRPRGCRSPPARRGARARASADADEVTDTLSAAGRPARPRRDHARPSTRRRRRSFSAASRRRLNRTQGLPGTMARVGPAALRFACNKTSSR